MSLATPTTRPAQPPPKGSRWREPRAPVPPPRDRRPSMATPSWWRPETVRQGWGCDTGGVRNVTYESGQTSWKCSDTGTNRWSRRSSNGLTCKPNIIQYFTICITLKRINVGFILHQHKIFCFTKNRFIYLCILESGCRSAPDFSLNCNICVMGQQVSLKW